MLLTFFLLSFKLLNLIKFYIRTYFIHFYVNTNISQHNQNFLKLITNHRWEFTVLAIFLILNLNIYFINPGLFVKPKLNIPTTVAILDLLPHSRRLHIRYISRFQPSPIYQLFTFALKRFLNVYFCSQSACI